ncbi:hypothetical protein ACFQVA_28760 [Actinomadura keratinilytica]
MPTRPHRSRTLLLSTALVLAVAASVSACSDSGSDEPGSQNGATPAGGLASQKLDWSTCKAPDDAQGGGTAPSPLPGGTEWQCATMKAPLDWDRPDGDTLDLALVRARTSAKNEDQRIGSLIFNFGGPGGSGVSTLRPSATATRRCASGTTWSASTRAGWAAAHRSPASTTRSWTTSSRPTPRLTTRPNGPT